MHILFPCLSVVVSHRRTLEYSYDVQRRDTDRGTYRAAVAGCKGRAARGGCPARSASALLAAVALQELIAAVPRNPAAALSPNKIILIHSIIHLKDII
jgi:hypothetical protein